MKFKKLFFYEPKTSLNRGSKRLLSNGDGTVYFIDELSSNQFLYGEGTRTVFGMGETLEEAKEKLQNIHEKNILLNYFESNEE